MTDRQSVASNDSYQIEELLRIIDEKDKLIKRQFIEIEALENEVASLKQDREIILYDNNHLSFELEMCKIKRLQDSRSVSKMPVQKITVTTDSVVCSKHKPSEDQSFRTAPPLKQIRSCSVDTDHNTPGRLGRTRQRSVSGNFRTKTTIRRIDEDALKRSRLHNSQYELSQDIIDKQLELLERKYGGACARKAAVTIQHAFRKYCIIKRFQDIANACKGERRLARRFPSIDLSSKEWTTANFIPPFSSIGSDREKQDAPLEVTLKSSISLDGNINSTISTLYKDHSETVEAENGIISKSPHCFIINKQERHKVPLNSEIAEEGPIPAEQGDAGSLQRRSLRRSKIPPQVPKRTSSIRTSHIDNASASSPAQENLVSTNASITENHSPLSDCDVSVQKNKSLANSSVISEDYSKEKQFAKRVPNESTPSSPARSYNKRIQSPHDLSNTSLASRSTEIQRKRQYRIGLNFFNKKSERGIRYLIQKGFLEATPQAVARFLLSRKGLSKQMIGEYLGDLQNPFNLAVLEAFAQELDLAGMQVDVALRKFLSCFRIPGEAQKIEHLMEVFSEQYNKCNPDIVSKFHNPDTVFVLAFAIIMLNTDLHTPNMKPERRMKLEDFIKNLRGVDEGDDLDRELLVGIYERIKANEFKTGSDHVTQVQKVEQTIVGKKPNLALPHRRLVCYCRLYEIYDMTKKERPGVHQREIFLFNDMLMVTKLLSKKKTGVTYTFRQSFPLCGMIVTAFEVTYYPHGIKLSQKVDEKVLICFNARNEHDRSKFIEDLKESITEMDEMESLRIEGELEKQKLLRAHAPENRDSGVVDMEIFPATKDCKLGCESLSVNLKRSTLSNSLLDLHEQQANKPVRRGSAGSLDSGMSVSFQSSADSTVSTDSRPQTSNISSDGTIEQKCPQQGFLGGIFSKKLKRHDQA